MVTSPVLTPRCWIRALVATVYVTAQAPVPVERVLHQVVGMNGYAVAMFRFIAITASTQVVGNDTVIIRQVIGEGLETERVGGYTRYTDNWSSVLAPLDIVKS